jgi:hypothetical protein
MWQKVLDFINSLYVAPTYIQAGAIIFLIFLLVISLAQFRHHFVKWSMKGGLIGLLFGVILTLILEGFLLVGGHTVLTGVLGWKNAPKPFSKLLDSGRQKLTDVLGVTNINPTTAKDTINIIQTLNPSETQKIKDIICTP